LLEPLGKLFLSHYPHATVIGFISDLSFSSGAPLHSGTTLFVFDETIPFAYAILEEISRFPNKYAATLKRAMASLPAKNTACLLLNTAFCNGEELALDCCREVLGKKNILLFGGSSGSGNPGVPSIFVNGVCHQNASVCLLLHNSQGKISLFSLVNYEPTPYTFVVTDASIPERTVYALNGQPASALLCTTFKKSEEELGPFLKNYSFGRIGKDTIHLAEFNKIEEGKGVSFFAGVYNETKLVLMKRGNYRESIPSSIQIINETCPKHRFSFVITCASQANYFVNEGYKEDYEKDLALLGPHAGFCPYGEQMDYKNFNQTIVVAVLD
jgi:hypothetical protein